MAFDELVFSQLHLLRGVNTHAGNDGDYLVTKDYSIKRNVDSTNIDDKDKDLTSAFIDNLPFQLTECQARVADEIFADLASDKKMSRLLQGDVGSGKTVVATLALLKAVEAGFQGALLVSRLCCL